MLLDYWHAKLADKVDKYLITLFIGYLGSVLVPLASYLVEMLDIVEYEEGNPEGVGPKPNELTIHIFVILNQVIVVLFMLILFIVICYERQKLRLERRTHGTRILNQMKEKGVVKGWNLLNQEEHECSVCLSMF